MSLNDIEEEVVFLKVINDLIDSMVSFDLFTLHGGGPNSTILFNTNIHQKYFNIILVDFLSPTAEDALVKQNSYLEALKAITEQPNFNVEGSNTALRSATTALIDWLEQEVAVNSWLPSISKQVSVKISRQKFIKMCGNISKHSVLKITRVANDLKAVLIESCGPVDLEEATLALSDFYEIFHTNVLNYHGSTIVEFLNNIRWGIHEYLQPELIRSFVQIDGDPPTYRYKYPVEINNKFARNSYWELMNDVRCKPQVRRFQVATSLKLRYQGIAPP